MVYIDVIPLETAKTYLGIDDTARDVEITRMINSACGYIEKYTNVLLVDREQTYYFDDNNCVRVYDFPINSLTSPANAVRTRRGTYSFYSTSTSSATELVLNVGYSVVADVPSDIVEAALEIIGAWFFSSEKRNETSLIPMSIKQVLDLHKRFLL
jgi:hypothetical protein